MTEREVSRVRAAVALAGAPRTTVTVTRLEPGGRLEGRRAWSGFHRDAGR